MLRHRASRCAATWDRVHAAIQNGGSSINHALSQASQRTSKGFTSGVEAAKGWAARVRSGTGPKLTAAFRSHRKGMTAISEWGATISASAAWGKVRNAGILADAWELRMGPLRRVTLGGVQAWGKTMQQLGLSGAGKLNSTAPGRPRWARRLASAFVR